VRRIVPTFLHKELVFARIAELRKEHREKHKLTVDDLLKELEDNRKAALEAEIVQSSAATAATMGKAKLLGLDKQIIDLKSSDGSMATDGLSSTERQARITALMNKKLGKVN